VNHQQGQRKKGSGARIVDILRTGPRTIDELAEAMKLTRTAVRAQLVSLQHDGVVEEREARRGTSKPSRTYGITAEAETRLSRAYAPVLEQLLRTLAGRMSAEEIEGLMREVGHQLALSRAAPRGDVRQRAIAANALLSSLGGSSELTEEEGRFTILGYGCPLAAVTADHPQGCQLIETLLSDFMDLTVTTCCARYDRKRCCFEVTPAKSA
jgi:predicted ArsR family transcriptional regulator